MPKTLTLVSDEITILESRIAAMVAAKAENNGNLPADMVAEWDQINAEANTAHQSEANLLYPAFADFVLDATAPKAKGLGVAILKIGSEVLKTASGYDSAKNAEGSVKRLGEMIGLISESGLHGPVIADKFFAPFAKILKYCHPAHAKAIIYTLGMATSKNQKQDGRTDLKEYRDKVMTDNAAIA